MSFLSPFPYMPMGSYSLMGRRITYRMDLSEDLRKRFEADVAEKAEETRAANERGIFTDRDVYWNGEIEPYRS